MPMWFIFRILLFILLTKSLLCSNLCSLRINLLPIPSCHLVPQSPLSLELSNPHQQCNSEGEKCSPFLLKRWGGRQEGEGRILGPVLLRAWGRQLRLITSALNKKQEEMASAERSSIPPDIRYLSSVPGQRGIRTELKKHTRPGLL